MSLLVVGSIAYDTVQTPAGRRERALGGSATYFALAASYFSDVSVLGVVGHDFENAHIELLASHGVDLSGVQRLDGRTFHWSGVYSNDDHNQRETLDTQLNVFAEFRPELNERHRRADVVFLANIDPALQLDVLRQMEARPAVVALDSMDFWIDGKRDALDEAMRETDIVFMDESEARSYSGEFHLLRAARRIMAAGPSAAVIKRGDHGALMFAGDGAFGAPAFPLETVIDPTGAGDSFAGGFMGTLAATGDTSTEGLRRAVIVGSVMGSFAVQDFSADRLIALTPQDIERRFDAFRRLTRFSGFGGGSFPRRHKERVATRTRGRID